MRSYKNTTVAILLACILTMAIGYAVLRERLDIKGTANINSEFNIQITGIKEVYIDGLASTASTSYTKDSANFLVDLQAPGDIAVYEVTVENLGNLTGYTSVSMANYERETPEDTVYSYLYCASKKSVSDDSFDEYNDCLYNTILLSTSEKLYYYVLVEFDSNATKLPDQQTFNYTYNFNFSQTDAGTVNQIDYLAKRPGDPSNYFFVNEWFNGMSYDVVERVTFTNSNIVPEDVIGSFDASNSQNGSIMAWYYDEDGDNLYEVFFGQNGGVMANPDSSLLFSSLSNLTEINGLEYFDTSNVVDMYGMFAHCKSLKNLDLSTFDTKNLSTLTYAFAWAEGLETVDLSSWDTSNVITMVYLFYNNKKLTTIYVGDKWDVSRLMDFDYPMFYNCTSLVGGSGTTYTYPNVYVDMANYQTGYLTYKAN